MKNFDAIDNLNNLKVFFTDSFGLNCYWSADTDMYRHLNANNSNFLVVDFAPIDMQKHMSKEQIAEIKQYSDYSHERPCRLVFELSDESGDYGSYEYFFTCSGGHLPWKFVPYVHYFTECNHRSESTSFKQIPQEIIYEIENYLKCNGRTVYGSCD
jgi:hypothetical protein